MILLSNGTHSRHLDHQPDGTRVRRVIWVDAGRKRLDGPVNDVVHAYLRETLPVEQPVALADLT